MKVRKPRTYEEERKIWYKKLSKSFQDIEKDEFNFKTGLNSSRFKNSNTLRDYHAKSEYYSMAGQFLNNFKFSSNLERIIWEYHSNAVSCRNIAKILRRVSTSRKFNKDSINKVIRSLVIEMKKLYLVGFKDE